MVEGYQKAREKEEIEPNYDKPLKTEERAGVGNRRPQHVEILLRLTNPVRKRLP
jgi:hypothetical protein